LEVGGVKVARSVAYGLVSEYTRLPTGEYDILLLATPETSSSSQVVAKTVANFRGGGVFSVVAADEPNRVTALVLEDNINPLFDQALVRFVHAAPDAPPLQWQGERGRVLIPQLAFGQASTFQAMRPGFTQVQVFTVAPRIPLQRFDLQLEAGKVYTLYVAGLLRSNPSLSGVLAEETRARRLL
jgi:pimeloyl-ACP methyl ester carboxylesterase